MQICPRPLAPVLLLIDWLPLAWRHWCIRAINFIEQCSVTYKSQGRHISVITTPTPPPSIVHPPRKLSLNKWQKIFSYTDVDVTDVADPTSQIRGAVFFFLLYFFTGLRQLHFRGEWLERGILAGGSGGLLLRRAHALHYDGYVQRVEMY